MKRLQLIVHGRVQGVGFRYFTTMEARKGNISGFVRNRHDGTVEIEAEGTDADMAAFTTAIEAGPRYGHVSRVDRIERTPTGETGFQIRY